MELILQSEGSSSYYSLNCVDYFCNVVVLLIVLLSFTVVQCFLLFLNISFVWTDC